MGIKYFHFATYNKTVCPLCDLYQRVLLIALYEWKSVERYYLDNSAHQKVTCVNVSGRLVGYHAVVSILHTILLSVKI